MKHKPKPRPPKTWGRTVLDACHAGTFQLKYEPCYATWLARKEHYDRQQDIQNRVQPSPSLVRKQIHHQENSMIDITSIYKESLVAALDMATGRVAIDPTLGTFEVELPLTNNDEVIAVSVFRFEGESVRKWIMWGDECLPEYVEMRRCKP